MRGTPTPAIMLPGVQCADRVGPDEKTGKLRKFEPRYSNHARAQDPIDMIHK